ncbi:hypothetical protein O181_031746 [Austropuccinia psidii MF-1]|uniref:DUF7143 domain-containing protein n=1 Tax=Austropuccinia psidii MF-1 TaxID=1389203 RepID=A0A9Q3CVG9_9BASI|nr:hypothetical protein [Austropuccinia psidii MF-1]
MTIQLILFSKNAIGQGLIPDGSAMFDDKPCYLLGTKKLPRHSKPNTNVKCLPQGKQALPPIPELILEGIKYSDIHYRNTPFTNPVMASLQLFEIDLSKKVPEQLIYLRNCEELYKAMNLGIRSLGNQLAHDELAQIKSAQAALHFQITRLVGNKTEIEKALKNLLASCVGCLTKNRHDIVLLAEKSGIDVQHYLDDLEKVCTPKSPCTEDKKNESSRSNAAKNDLKLRRKLLLVSLIVALMQLDGFLHKLIIY